MKHRGRRGIAGLLAAVLLIGQAGAVNWGLSYRDGSGKPPTGEVSSEALAQYSSYYMGDPTKKVLYLTFDCGYENGNTAPILDVLRAQHVPAAFFVVGHYLESAPDLVRRMDAEGHLVCNHSLDHPNMTTVSAERFARELNDLAQACRQVTGKAPAPFFRPPEGAFNTANLAQAQKLGYHTTLWSVAYADWDPKNQPSRESALRTLRSRVHPGAIVLLHAVSSTNAAILNELIEGWRAEGYTFEALSSLPGLPNPTVTARPGTARFVVDGQEAAFAAYLVQNEHYVRLRDLAAALAGSGSGFGVDYDPAAQTVKLTRGQAYVPNGGELAGTPQVAAMQAKPGAQALLLDGAPLSCTAFSIAGENYIRLRDLAGALGCMVGWDEVAQTVTVQTDRNYFSA